jgi:ribose transport system substrate-binding protein
MPGKHKNGFIRIIDSIKILKGGIKMRCKRKNVFLITLISILVLGQMLLTGCPGETKKELPPGPAFDSVLAAPPDEGKVQPVSQNPNEEIRILVIGLENNPFWIPVKQGVMDAAKKLASKNCVVDWVIPGDQHTTDVFGNAIDAGVAQEYDAIATIAGEEGIVPFINRAVDAGIPIATFNSETAKENKRLFFVGANSYLQGEAAGKAMIEALGDEGGKVAVITGFFAVEAHELRRKGFLDYVAKNAPNIEIVGEVENTDKADIAYTQTQDFMNSNPDLSGIYVTAGGPFGAAAAVEDAGKGGKIKIICYDFVDETMEYVKKGVIYGTVGQDPYAQGHDPVIRLFNYLVDGVVPPAGLLYTRADVVTKDNMADFGF